MSEHLKIISEAIHNAIEEAPYKVVIVKDKFSVSDGTNIIFQSPLHDQAEDMMDSFNDAWIARKTVEAMRDLNLKFDSVYDRSSWIGKIEGILKE